jgi:hypothetical protein
MLSSIVLLRGRLCNCQRQRFLRYRKPVFHSRKEQARVPLDPQDLGDLIAIRDAGTLSAAAKARVVAVSTVSRRIETLEAALRL